MQVIVEHHKRHVVYRVSLGDGQYAKGRFHTRAQAEAWIVQQLEKAAKARQNAHRADSTAITDSNYYASNEALIKEV